MTKTRTILTLGLEVHVLMKLTDCRRNDSRCVLSNNTQAHARQDVGRDARVTVCCCEGCTLRGAPHPTTPGHPARTLSGRVSWGARMGSGWAVWGGTWGTPKKG